MNDMNFTKTEHRFNSSNGTDKVAYYVYTPAVKPKAVVQISHGMCEYIGRYEHFIDYLCRLGYAVIGHDHLGHGNTVSCDEDLGFFALENGWLYLIKDLHRMMLIGKKRFPDIPYFMLGHSMGSIILRCFLAKYSTEIDGAVILGTVGRHPALPAMIALAEAEASLHGVKSRPSNINRLLFGFSNMRVEDRKTEFDWISRDDDIVARYVADKKCSFIFTAAGFRDLFTLTDYCTSFTWYRKVRCDIPLLLAAGSEDPVGSYGRGVMRFFRELDRHGFTDVEIKLCDGCRHEVLNELNRIDIYEEIGDWLETRLAAADRT